MDNQSRTILFSRGAVELSRFIAGLDGVVGESREALRLAALAAMDALEQGHQYALLSEYAGCTGQGRGLEVRFPGKDEWHCALRKAAANCRKILSKHECGAYTVPRTPLVAVFSGDDVHIYLQRNFNAEHVIAERWAQLFIMNREKPMQGISSKFLDVICCGNYSQADEHQKKAVQSAVRNHFTFITGGPGTGKTTVLAKILLLELKRNPELQFVLCAPTGKGQARISESLNAELEDLSKVVVDSGSGRTVADECKDALKRLKNPECSTVHSLLGRYQQGEMPYDLLVMDEGSMASLPLLAEFFMHMKRSARVLICGDRNQLPSVDEGAVINDLYHAGGGGNALMPGVVRELKTNFRSKSAEHIVEFSSRMPGLPEEGDDDCEAFAHRLLSCDENDFHGIAWNRSAAGMEKVISQLLEPDGRFYGQAGSPFARIKELAKNPSPDARTLNEAFKALDEFKILCAVREGRFGVNAINDALRKALKLNGDVPGLPIMITRNDHKGTGLSNGDCGIIWSAQNGVVAYFPDGKHFALPLLPPWEAVFAMTIHKSQGSGYDKVLTVIPDGNLPVVTRELIYTAITRARKCVWLAAEPGVLAAGLRRCTNRHSSLPEQLDKVIKNRRKKMIYVVARAIVKPECLDQYLAAVNEIIPTVLAEDGCIRYEACLDWTEDGSRRPAVIMLETWAGKAHLDAHLAAAHMKEFMQKVAPFREGSELQILKPALP